MAKLPDWLEDLAPWINTDPPEWRLYRDLAFLLASTSSWQALSGADGIAEAQARIFSDADTVDPTNRPRIYLDRADQQYHPNSSTHSFGVVLATFELDFPKQIWNDDSRRSEYIKAVVGDVIREMVELTFTGGPYRVLRHPYATPSIDYPKFSPKSDWNSLGCYGQHQYQIHHGLAAR